MKVLVIGSGGREHALVWKLAQSPLLTALHAAPGNPGIAEHAELHEVSVDDLAGLEALAVDLAIDLVVIGPEAPLVKGLADRLRARKIAVFGPGAEGAELEGSKAFSKQLMNHNGIPTAGFRILSSERTARDYLNGAVVWPLVLKASGLAAGKGVFIVKNREEADAALEKLMVSRAFGRAGETIVAEDFLTGPEVSVHVLTDGTTFLTLPTATDHKRLLEGDEGPNTGGMGAISPAKVLNSREQLRIERDILAPTLHALRREEREYRGAIFAGLMMTRGGPRVLEYNARFGDPETQVILPRLKGDLLPLLHAAATGRLEGVSDEAFDYDPRVAITVVMASSGYPGFFTSGHPIEGLEVAKKLPDVHVFQAGTAIKEGVLVTAGGRVLSVTALGEDAESAREKAYAAVRSIRFAGAIFRRDIGQAKA